MKIIALKIYFYITLMLLTCVLNSGCLIAEKETVEIDLSSPLKGRVVYLYEGIKSDSNSAEEIKKDFEGLTALVSEEARAEALEQDKIKIERWNLDIDEKGVVFGAIDASFNVAEFFDYNQYLFSNGEIIIVLPLYSDQSVTSNAKILKTKNNYILTWPQSSKKLVWTVHNKNALKYPNNLSKYILEDNSP